MRLILQVPPEFHYFHFTCSSEFSRSIDKFLQYPEATNESKFITYLILSRSTIDRLLTSLFTWDAVFTMVNYSVWIRESFIMAKKGRRYIRGVLG